MKGKFKALFMSGVLMLSLTALSPVTAFAADAGDNTFHFTGYATPGENVGDAPGEIKNEAGETVSNIGSDKIPVQAEIIGSAAKIIYNVEVEYGGMKFSYDFGQTWDPETHTYLNTGGKTGGWIIANCIDGINNAISITNNSNYPIHAELSFTPLAGTQSRGTKFNAVKNSNGAVVGIFSDSNDTLANNINTASYCGYGASAVTTALTKPGFDLDMDYSLVDENDVDYGVLADTSVGYTKTVYFALCGKPDASVSLGDDPSVGNITLTITPASTDKITNRP